MILDSLLLMSVAASLGIVAVLLVWTGSAVVTSAHGKRQKAQGKGRQNTGASLRCLGLGAVTAVCLLGLSGCGRGTKPEAIWLETGIGKGQVVYPRGITYSPADDTFYIVDREARIQHLDHNGQYLNEWRTPAWKIGKPVGLSVGPDGNVYVPDTHYNTLRVYSPQGKELRHWGGAGTGPGQFIYPTDAAFDDKGHVFVSEYGDHDRVQVFTLEGKYLYEFGSFGQGDGQFSRPESMVIDHGLVYITDACNHRIVVFKTDGTWVRNMGSVGDGPGQFRYPYGLDEDADGNLVVCEFGNNRIQLIDKQTGKSLKIWGTAGRDPGQLAYPWGVAVDKRNRIVAVDAGNNRLQVFRF
jgi:DNA-binding beta-propeller fold protein YncE